jgi:hypothetical protein
MGRKGPFKGMMKYGTAVYGVGICKSNCELYEYLHVSNVSDYYFDSLTRRYTLLLFISYLPSRVNCRKDVCAHLYICDYVSFANGTNWLEKSRKVLETFRRNENEKNEIVKRKGREQKLG